MHLQLIHTSYISSSLTKLTETIAIWLMAAIGGRGLWVVATHSAQISYAGTCSVKQKQKVLMQKPLIRAIYTIC